MKRILFFSFLILTLSAAAQQPRIVTDTIYSQVLDAPRAYTVMLPPSFYKNPDTRYPILYLLHGMYGKNDDWTSVGQANRVADQLMASGEADEMIIVTPDAGGGHPNDFQNGYFDVKDWPYETFFFTEFMPQIEEKYRAIGDKQHRAIAGLSMGGGGTTAYAQKHSDLFCAAYAMSAWLEADAEDARRAADPDSRMGKLMNSVVENGCVQFVKNADDAAKDRLRTVRWYVDCGDDDFLLDVNNQFYRAMRDAGIPCQLRVRDGGHTWEYWHSALYQCLPFVSRSFNN